ncbi:hypothetical protein AC578_8125 [Pseudocercospora eumusae]|uniref:VanZ-like domain-containing protein n=1 Tax=Pseudocercospora eumusae TaxID=321146 RepID=A0A139HAH4_9PEZI|nr:hypothetical protein AC578_8125 [Pseudocercospora eumusae]
MMPAGLHIRKPFAASFAALLLVSAYLGLSTSKIPQYGQSDKGLLFITFLLLTITFYWAVELPRRRCIHLTLLVCTAGLGIGSEVLQGLLPNGRDFDPYDILANVVGSGSALLLCSWYHKRMLERRRKNKHYDIVPGEQGDLGDEERDVELGDGPGLGAQERGTISAEHTNRQPTTGGAANTNVTEELDNWDENEEDWEEEGAEGARVTAGAGAEEEPARKRTD